MPALSPTISATLAKDVYALVNYQALEDVYIYLNKKHKKNFTFNNNNMVKGKTGGPGIIKCRTAFGFTLVGQGAFEGHAFILFRGTEFLADWLTNFNTTVSSSACGQPVHDGFNETFNTMKPKLLTFMLYLQSQKIQSVHCIGHSLGGAIATLCADWIAKSWQKPYLYTFGSPRVGLAGFARACTRRLKVDKQDRIFRAYHRTDIVPLVPVWPFIHTPTKGKDYYLPSPGIIPWGTYHKVDTYVTSVTGRTWELLGSTPAKHTNAGIERWLKRHPTIGFTLSSIEWLSDALLYVLKKCAGSAALAISNTFTSTFSLMDQIAYILKKGLDKTKSVSEWVIRLLNRIMFMLGYNRSAVLAVEYNQEMIRFLFMKLQYRFNTYAKRALNQALVRGQSV